LLANYHQKDNVYQQMMRPPIDVDMAAMLVYITREANEKSLSTYNNMAAMTSHVNKLNDSNDKTWRPCWCTIFVNVQQHGGDDVKLKRVKLFT
jgi:hypothetical protein